MAHWNILEQEYRTKWGRSECTWLEDEESCQAVSDCSWNMEANRCGMNNATARTITYPRDQIKQMMKIIRTSAHYQLPVLPYPSILYNMLMKPHEDDCLHCTSTDLDLMYTLPLETQAFIVYFLGVSSLCETMYIPTVAMPILAKYSTSAEQWSMKTKMVDTMFPRSMKHTRYVSRSLVSKMLKWATVGMLLTRVEAGHTFRTYCFSAHEESYTNNIPSLPDIHSPICATFDNRFDTWIYQHSIETGSSVKPQILSQDIVNLNPIISCFTGAGTRSTGPATDSGAWCEVQLDGNTIASYDTNEAILLIFFGIIACGVKVFQS